VLIDTLYQTTINYQSVDIPLQLKVGRESFSIAVHTGKSVNNQTNIDPILIECQLSVNQYINQVFVNQVLNMMLITLID